MNLISTSDPLRLKWKKSHWIDYFQSLLRNQDLSQASMIFILHSQRYCWFYCSRLKSSQSSFYIVVHRTQDLFLKRRAAYLCCSEWIQCSNLQFRKEIRLHWEVVSCRAHQGVNHLPSPGRFSSFHFTDCVLWSKVWIILTSSSSSSFRVLTRE